MLWLEIEMGKLEGEARSRGFWLRWDMLRHIFMYVWVGLVEREKVLMQERKGVIMVGKSLSWEVLDMG